VLRVRLPRYRPAGEEQRGPERRRAALLTAGELLALLVWALWFARPYLDLDPAVVPAGREYGSTINLHHLWTWARACGLCALWDGSVRGGSPAFADPYGSTLHPLVALTTLGWGVPAGAKLALAGAFFMGGLAQWWLGRVLGLGRVACVWSGAMAVVAGNLSGRMELGAFALVISTAACALVLPPLVAVGLTGSPRAAVALGLTLALAALAGQAYLQIGLVFALPAALLLLPWGAPRASGLLGAVLRRYALAAGIAVLLAAPFLVPLLHFLPQFGKDTDPLFRSAQPFPYVPLNLVIADLDYYTSDALRKLPFPAVYVNYVGWLPVLLAVIALGGQLPPATRRAARFLAVFAVLILWQASAAPFAWLARLAPRSVLAQSLTDIRYPALIAGLAVPCLLGLAALGTDRLLRWAWPRLRIAIMPNPSALAAPRTGGPGPRADGALALDTRWLLAVPLVLAVVDAWSFDRQWVRTVRMGAEVEPVLSSLRTPDLQWVDIPFGEHYWVEPATGMGLKLAMGIQRFSWKGHSPPEPVREATRSGPPDGMALLTTTGGVGVYAAPPGGEYAAVERLDGTRTVCTAHGAGGDVDVHCAAPSTGVLTVKENAWSGWQARVDGRPAPLLAGPWLAVELPAGSHTVGFRYRPWDVPLGLVLATAGVGGAVWAWRAPDPPPAVPGAPQTPRAPPD
jgi:hypothetical protein